MKVWQEQDQGAWFHLHSAGILVRLLGCGFKIRAGRRRAQLEGQRTSLTSIETLWKMK